MILSAQALAHFVAANIPGPAFLAVGGLASLAWAAACLAGCGYLKTRKKIRTAYTRKLFHFLIFGTVVLVHGKWGTPGVCLFGGMTSLIIGYALMRGPGHMMYEAMAREKDAPRRTYYIVAPYLATLAGGLVSNLLWPSAAVFGYLVTGLGDAVAEPVGTRFGKHIYKAPSIGGVRATRSLEGSCAVFIASALALTAWLVLNDRMAPWGSSLGVIGLISLVATLVEAVSPHGWDNATLQVVPAMLGAIWL